MSSNLVLSTKGKEREILQGKGRKIPLELNFPFQSSFITFSEVSHSATVLETISPLMRTGGY